MCAQDIKVENFVNGNLVKVSRLFYKFSMLIPKPTKKNGPMSEKQDVSTNYLVLEVHR